MLANKRKRIGPPALGIFTLIMLLPIVGIFLNAVATDWAGTVLPEGYTTAWFVMLINDPRFLTALVNSMILAIATMAVSAFVCVPAILVAHCYFPALDRLIGGLVILPYAVPTIVLALGLLRLYSGNYGVRLNGTPWILVLGYIPLGASFYYIPIKNNLRAIRVTEILEAGYLVGASDFAILRKIILPSVARGLVVGLVMNFTLVISEFVYINLLVGSFFPTMQTFMNLLRTGSGHVTSALIVVYFVSVWLATTIVAMILRSEKETA